MNNNELYLRRKIDRFLLDWKRRDDHMPLIIKGARQIGKTRAIHKFAVENYENVIEINFATMTEYRNICKDGYLVDDILRNISIINPSLEFTPASTLFFFDELQAYPAIATALKPFREDGRFDVICSGSMMGVNYHEIESNAVGNKEDYDMHSLDFEEFLWALGYQDSQIEDLYHKMQTLEPLSAIEYDTFLRHFRDYIVLGGMPAIVRSYIINKNFSGTLEAQRQIIRDYEEDITKYAGGLDHAKILQAYRAIPVFLGNENKKFQITKLEKGARNREFVGVKDWLVDSGIVNPCYCLNSPLELPLRGNYDPSNYRLYFGDTGLLIGSLDDEAQDDLRKNKNFNTYKGAVYENIVADMLIKSGYHLYFYRNDKGTIEMDFFVRDANSLIPIEVKASDGASASLKRLITSDAYPDIKYGIKLGDKNIGYNGQFYTFPYFLTFLLRRFLSENPENRSNIS